MAFRGGKVERRSSTPLALAVRLLTSRVSQASLGGNLFVPRRFSGHSRSVFRGTRGPIANCGFFLEARRKRRGCTTNHPYPGKETQNGGTTRSEHQTSEAGRQSAAKHAISCTDRSSPLSHPPSMAGAKLHTMHVKDLPVSQRRRVVERHGSRCSNCASFSRPQSRPVLPESPNRVITTLLAATSVKPHNFDIFFLQLFYSCSAALTDAALQTPAFSPIHKAHQAHDS